MDGILWIIAVILVIAGIVSLVRGQMIMGIVLIGLIAYVFDLMMRKAAKWLVPWKGRM